MTRGGDDTGMASLIFIDVLGVQRYVFSSNRLRDVVGSSILVRRATDATNPDGVLALVLREVGDAVSVLSDAGGNAVIRVAGPDHEAVAARIAACYSRRLLDDAPGLDVLMHRSEYLGGVGGGLARALRDGFRDAARAKASRRTSSPLLGLGVTESCAMTGMPAARRDRGVPVSARVVAARAASRAPGVDGSDLLHQAGFALTNELDELGRTPTERSLIGVVHVDGNRVGALIRRWLDEAVEAETSDEDVASQYGAWSRALAELGASVQRALFDAVTSAILRDDERPPRLIGLIGRLSFELATDDAGRVLLPIRPVILGGDDLTFICDGRIALSLAEVALAAIEVAPEIPHLGRIRAAAGVSIVHAHAPFSRAVDLAHALTTSAKSLTRESSAIDWHLGATRPGAGVETIRERRQPATARPMLLDGEAPSWRWLTGEVLDEPEHGLRGDAWEERRAKVKHLAAIAAAGHDALRRQLVAWRALDEGWDRNPAIRAIIDRGAGAGDEAQRAALFDAAELLDIHQPLPVATP